MLIAAAFAVVVTSILVLAGRGRAAGTRSWPRTSRDVIATALLCTAAAPAAFRLASALSASDVTVVGAGAALVLGVGARAFVGPVRGLAVVTGVTTLVVVVDLIHRSARASDASIAFGDGLEGITIGAALVAAGIVLDVTSDRRARVGVVTALAAVATALVAPALGGMTSAAVVAVPSFGVFGMIASGRRITAPTVAIIVVVTAAVTGSIAVAGIAGADAGHPGLGIAERLDTALDLMLGTIWPVVIVVVPGALVLVAKLRPGVFDRAMWGQPALRAALIAAGVAAVLSVLTDERGLVAAAYIVVFGSVAASVALLAPDG